MISYYENWQIKKVENYSKWNLEWKQVEYYENWNIKSEEYFKDWKLVK
jgi:antitoxin component YwqK of YwqJK toxin-antitoxin module